MDDEIWKPIMEFEGYEVSSLGRVRSWRGPGGKQLRPVTAPKILRSSPNSKGYPVNVFMQGGHRHTRTLHVIVATHFHGPCPDGYECSHLDGVRANCRADNLAWERHKRNMERTIDHGTNGAGIRNGRAKLTLEQAAAVIPRRNNGESLSSIAREYGVTVTTIWQIYHKKNWR
jgi:hypothetical protein